MVDQYDINSKWMIMKHAYYRLIISMYES